ncbi:hypothetical protein ABZ349_27880 [Streptomyces niveus]|uniref:hypothetical protein n=1 Tax=Streptomyces niveus TaxID=193462 RepID=UPI0033F11283
MSEDAERLLAGLTCRITAQDAAGRWAIGNWFFDPLTRPGWLSSGGEDRSEKQLHGYRYHWTLQRNGSPYVEDVAASLTASPASVSGAIAPNAGSHFEVSLGNTTLRLDRRRAPAQQESEVTR